MLLANLFAKVLHHTTRAHYYFLGGTATLPPSGGFVTCNLFVVVHVPMLQYLANFHPLAYMALTFTPCYPHPTGITVNMDQMTMPRTYHWLQVTCTGRSENSMRRANSYQVERGTRVHGHLHGCEDQASEGGASVDLSSSNCTWSLQWQK